MSVLNYASLRRVCHHKNNLLILSLNGSPGTVSSRRRHQWRVSAMFPGVSAASPGVLSGREAGSPGGQAEDQTEDSRSRSQKLMYQNNMIRGGGAAGTFSLLPFTTRVIEKLYRVIDQEMYAIGAQKISMPCLSGAKAWKFSGRWDLMGAELLTLDDRKGTSHCLAPTHEEAVTSIVAAEGTISYKRLPIMLYQIGRKFRDEMRPKNGLLRCREFEMKDLYTFDEDEENGSRNYDQVCSAYDKIFERLGLKYIKVEADTGAMGGSLSHEFQLLADVGEDLLYQCQECGRAFNREIVEKGEELCPSKCTQGSPNLKDASGIEVAHAFLLGTRYSSKFKAIYTGRLGDKRPLFMGCFGIGVTRLIAAAVEVLSTADEIRWPRLLVPYQVVIIPQKEGFQSEKTWDLCQGLYSTLDALPNISGECVLDDRVNLSIGKRLNHAKQLGYPIAIIAGKKALEDQPKYEVVDIYRNTKEYLSLDQIVETMKDLETIKLW